MNTIRERLKSNVLLYSTALDFLSWVSPNTRKYNSFISEISQIDPISEYEKFCECIMDVKGKSEITLPRYDRYGREAFRHYGYYREILNYAGVSEKGIVMIPSLEHGIRFGSQSWEEVDLGMPYSISCACQGPGRSSEAHFSNPWRPVFVLGPYIHYASGCYSREETGRMKEIFGRTLLVMPSHTTERNKSKSDSWRLFDAVYRKYASKYDSVLVCSYWNDIDSPELEDYRRNGAVLVSAGFRNDPNFIRRLKTLLSLSDCVIVDSIGTNIGFAIYMGRPVYIEGSYPENVVEDKMLAENFCRFHDAFHSPDVCFTDRQMDAQRELYEFFWGGEKYLKSPEEIREILTVLHEMCAATHYDIKRMPTFIREKCFKSSGEHRYRVLSEAIDPSVREGCNLSSLTEV